jgi:hypothetical protein
MPVTGWAAKSDPLGNFGKAPELSLAAPDRLPADDSGRQRPVLTDSAVAFELVAFLRHLQDRLPADSSLRVDLVTLGARLERYRSRL